jgi:aspartate/methionine/tyrosine aminotransferase
MKIEPFRLERYFAKHEFSAPYPLCSSDCETMSVAQVLALEAGAAERFQALPLGYTESWGAPSLRDAIAGLYVQVERADVLVHVGAQEAIFNFMNVALAPGDHVVVHSPCYQSLGEVARAIGCEVSAWRGEPEEGWALDIRDLEGLLTGRTKLVVVNLPHNPTGFLPDAEFLRRLSSLSESHGFRIFCDEVYRGLELDAADRLPAAADLNPRSVSLGVMSKTYGLAGLRVGWVACRDAELLAKMAAFKDYTTICNGAASEFLAEVALRNAGRVAARNVGIVRDNLDLLDAFFARHGDRFRWRRPRAGSVAFPSLLRDEAERFCADALEAGVLLLPGTLFEPGLNAFRIGFGRTSLPANLARFEDHLAHSAR